MAQGPLPPPHEDPPLQSALPQQPQPPETPQSASSPKRLEETIELLAEALAKSPRQTPGDNEDYREFNEIIPDENTIRSIQYIDEEAARRLVNQSIDARERLLRDYETKRLRQATLELKRVTAEVQSERARIAWAVVSSIALAFVFWNLVSKFDDFLAAFNHVTVNGFNLFASPAYAAENTGKPLTPSGQQKIIIIYVVYGAICVTLCAALGLMFAADKDKQENGKDIAKIVIGFLIGTITGRFAD